MLLDKISTPTPDPLVYSGKIAVPYSWSVGQTGSRFFIELRDNQKIFGTHCPACRLTFVPPRKVCPRCFEAELLWKEVADSGILVTYTVLHYYCESMHPIKPPFGFGIIKLDGADTGLTHLIGNFEPAQLQSGARVKAVFASNRKGNMLDIKFFKPLP